MIIFYFRTGITPDSGGAAVYYYVVSNRAPFALGCFGPITTEAECRALYPECDGVAQSFTTAHGTDDYDLDCPCFNPVTGGNMPGQGKPNYLGPNGFDAYQLDLMQGDRACNTLDGVSRACTQEEKDAVSALYSSQKCGNSGTTTMTCADITGATGGAFDCASQTNSINASPASITCGNQASGCTASECCTVAPAKTCANAGTQGGAFDCAGETNDINANPGSVTCDSQTAGCTATECCTVVPANSGTNNNENTDSTTPSGTSHSGTTEGGSGSSSGSNTNVPSPTSQSGSTEGTGSSSGSNTNVPSPNTDSASTTPSSESTSNAIPDVEVEYAVKHTIVLKGMSANQFNEDPLIVQSFRESVSKLLNVPITDIINVVAIDSSLNRLRNLDGSASCDVSYKVKVNSKTEMNTMSSNIQSTFTDNATGDTTFTEAIQTAMISNNVSSIASSTITSDTTSAPKDAGTLNPNNSNEAGNEVGNDDSNDNTVSVEPDKQNVNIGLIAGLGIGGLLTLSLVGYFFFARSSKKVNLNKPSVGLEMTDSTIKMKDNGYANPMNMNK